MYPCGFNAKLASTPLTGCTGTQHTHIYRWCHLHTLLQTADTFQRRMCVFERREWQLKQDFILVSCTFFYLVSLLVPGAHFTNMVFVFRTEPRSCQRRSQRRSHTPHHRAKIHEQKVVAFILVHNLWSVLLLDENTERHDVMLRLNQMWSDHIRSTHAGFSVCSQCLHYFHTTSMVRITGDCWGLTALINTWTRLNEAEPAGLVEVLNTYLSFLTKIINITTFFSY